MMISPGVFFHFSKILIFQVRGIKGQKWSKMTKKFCCTHISGTIHHMKNDNIMYTCVK